MSISNETARLSAVRGPLPINELSNLTISAKPEEVKQEDKVKEKVKKIKENEKKEVKQKRVKSDPMKDSDGKPYRKAIDFKDYDENHHACTGKGGCGLVKPKSEFVKDKAVKSGVRNICKSCKNKSIRDKNASKNNLTKSKSQTAKEISE